jgi:hypothetical protein
VPWLSGGSDTPPLLASLALASLALAAAGGGIAYSITAAGASGGERASRGMGHRGVRVGSAARVVAWGAARQVAVAALAAASTAAVGALLGARVA